MSYILCYAKLMDIYKCEGSIKGMKKLIQVVAAAIVSVGLVGTAAGAVSCSDINVHTSGNNNQTTITCTTITNVTVSCTNNIIAATVNFQDGTSGNASGSGDVRTGTVVNYNNSNTTVGAACGTPVGTTSPSPSPSTSVTPTPSTKPKALPNTATNDTASIVASSLVAAVGVVALSRVAVAAYRRIGNK